MINIMSIWIREYKTIVHEIITGEAFTFKRQRRVVYPVKFRNLIHPFSVKAVHLHHRQTLPGKRFCPIPKKTRHRFYLGKHT